MKPKAMIDELLLGDEPATDERISKSQQKRDSKEIMDFAMDLSKLTLKKVAQLHLPEEIYEEFVRASTIKSHSAKKRQVKYIGGLIRNSGVYEELKQTYLKIYKKKHS